MERKVTQLLRQAEISCIVFFALQEYLLCDCYASKKVVPPYVVAQPPHYVLLMIISQLLGFLFDDIAL